MIKFTNDNKQIISLWQNSFGDSEKDILFFIYNSKNTNCLGYFVNDKLVSMTFLVDSSMGKYIYAACTDKNHEGQGYMTQILDYCKMNYNSLCLIPANDSLVDFYKKRGFCLEQSINDLKFNQIKEINEYLFEGYSLTKPVVLQYKRG